MKKLPFRLRFYVTLLPASALLMVTLLLAGYRADHAIRDLATAATVAVLIACARGYPLHVGPKQKLLADTAAVIAAILLLPVALAALAAAAGCLATGIWLRRKPLDTAFNAAVLALSATGSGLVLRGLTSSAVNQQPLLPSNGIALIGVSLLAATTYYLLQGLLVHAAIGLQLGQNPLGRWLEAQRRLLPQESALILCGVLAALTAREQWWTLLVLAVPASVVYHAMREGVANRVQTREAIEQLADTIDLRDVRTAGRSQRTAALAHALAVRLGLPNQELEKTRIAARIQSIEEAAWMPGGLAPQLAASATSDATAAALLSRLPDFREPLSLNRLRYERFDAAARPPAAARVLAVASAFEHLTHPDPNRSPLSVDEALTEIRLDRGSRYDPQVVDALTAHLESETHERGAISFTFGARRPLPSI